jgi:hypothetical protein
MAVPAIQGSSILYDFRSQQYLFVEVAIAARIAGKPLWTPSLG